MLIPRPFRFAMCPVLTTCAFSPVDSLDHLLEGENFLFRPPCVLPASSDLTMGVSRVWTISGGKQQDFGLQATRIAYQQQ